MIYNSILPFLGGVLVVVSTLGDEILSDTAGNNTTDFNNSTDVDNSTWISMNDINNIISTLDDKIKDAVEKTVSSLTDQINMKILDKMSPSKEKGGIPQWNKNSHNPVDTFPTKGVDAMVGLTSDEVSALKDSMLQTKSPNMIGVNPPFDTIPPSKRIAENLLTNNKWKTMFRTFRKLPDDYCCDLFCLSFSKQRMDRRCLGHIKFCDCDYFWNK